VQRLKISQFYGAPTAIRLLLKYGDDWVKKYDRSSLRTLGSGEHGAVAGEGVLVQVDLGALPG
jgi:acyl-coenzyme A synthetase/AMP-(fatty) acid ligase